MTAHLTSLLDAVLALRPALDEALVAAGQAPFARIDASGDEPKGTRAEWPRCTVSLEGDRTHEAPVIGGQAEWTVTDLLVTVAAHVDGSQDDALAYEQALAETLRRSAEAVAAGLPAGVDLSDWRLDKSSLVRPDGRVNVARQAWAASVSVRALVQW